MNTVLSLIIMLCQNTLTTNITYTIARYIIEHIDEMKDKSIKQLSEDCFTSTSSINKFCNLLGFNSYSEFKNQLLYNFDVRKVQLKNKHEQLDEKELFQKIQLFSITVINEKELFEKIDKLIQFIHEKKKIYFYGAVYPLALTQSFIEDMAVMGVVVNNQQLSRGNNKIDQHELTI